MRELDIIPDLGDIIAGYTGGECDASTTGGSTCWAEHDGCEKYCFDNLESWLYAFVSGAINNEIQATYRHRGNDAESKADDSSEGEV